MPRSATGIDATLCCTPVGRVSRCCCTRAMLLLAPRTITSAWWPDARFWPSKAPGRHSSARAGGLPDVCCAISQFAYAPVPAPSYALLCTRHPRWHRRRQSCPRFTSPCVAPARPPARPCMREARPPRPAPLDQFGPCPCMHLDRLAVRLVFRSRPRTHTKPSATLAEQ